MKFRRNMVDRCFECLGCGRILEEPGDRLQHPDDSLWSNRCPYTEQWSPNPDYFDSETLFSLSRADS